MLGKRCLRTVLLLWISIVSKSLAFVSPFSRNSGRNIGNGNGNGGRVGGPPRVSNDNWGDHSNNNDGDTNLGFACYTPNSNDIDQEVDNDNENFLSMRGGSTKQTLSHSDTVVSHTIHTLSKTASYWSNAVNQAIDTVSSGVQSILKRKSEQEVEEEKVLQELQAIPIRAASVPNSTVLPDEVIHMAAKRSGMIGRPLRHESVQEMARSLKQWYTRKGYLLHSVTGATLRAEDGTAVISVQEPTISQSPVGITICKEMVVDEETGELMTFKEYKSIHAKRRTFGHKEIKKTDLNTTFVETSGRTNPKRIARALQLIPGKPFLWQKGRWESVMGSDIFGRVLQAQPERMDDGTVQFNVIATEKPPRNLEYGVTKSLYTGSWEGELDFQHRNLLGGGEAIGLQVRRGTHDAEPSVKVCFSDNKFGFAGGYDVELFADYIGNEDDTNINKGTEGSTTDENTAELAMDYDQDAPLARKGARFCLQNPIKTNRIQHSTGSASVERISTRAGLHENVATATLGLGPFRKELPLDARTNVMGILTTGTRLSPADDTNNKSSNSIAGWNLLPYSTGTVTTRQIFPLANNNNNNGRSIDLAFSHSVMTSSPNFPRHEAHAAGIAATLRGYSSKAMDRITSSVKGTTEVRIPMTLPTTIKGHGIVGQDTSLVLFADWLYAKSDVRSSPISRKASIGAGFRKQFQGLPLKLDFSYTQDGKLSSTFGIGGDFDA